MCISNDIFVATFSGEVYYSYRTFTIYVFTENAQIISHVNDWHRKVIVTAAQQ